ncbi:MAG TPA: MlaD family protein, partial [Kofleriaceae bacterium]|nr:MlaD family protein [Kofleriaceae bacterium]
MKNLSQAVKVGILALVLVVGSYAVWRMVGSSPAGEDSYTLWARLKDASGLPVGSEVRIAGLPVGEIADLDIIGRRAKVTLRVRDDVVVWDNAILMKESSSILGGYYLAIDPGMQTTFTASGKKLSHERLNPGDEITRVIGATSPEELMRRLQETIPKVDAVLLSVRDLSEDVRGIVNGPLKSIAARIDKLVQDEATTVSSILHRTDSTIARIEDITKDIREVTRGADQDVQNILDNLEDASAEAKNLMTTARTEVELTGAEIREKLQKVDQVLGHSGSIAEKIDNNEGTLGKLVNDPTIAENVEDITDSAKGFVDTLFGMQTYVGLRSEYNVFSQLARFYITAELHTRPDKYYLIEFEKGPRGDYPDVSLVYNPATMTFQKRVEIEDKIRFTFQFARQFGWLTVRYGIKESTGGIGFDGDFFDDR